MRSCSLSDKSFCHLLHIPWRSPYPLSASGLLQPNHHAWIRRCRYSSESQPHNLPYLRFAVFNEHRETADHSQYEIEGVLKITFLLALIVLTTLAIRNAGKEGSHQILQLMAIALRHHIYYLNNPGIRWLRWLQITGSYQRQETAPHFIIRKSRR